jgi:hypothetical protein
MEVALKHPHYSMYTAATGEIGGGSSKTITGSSASLRKNNRSMYKKLKVKRNTPSFAAAGEEGEGP